VHVEAIAWRQGDFPAARGAAIGCLFTPTRRRYNGRERVQMVIERLWAT
jgi:hypothetical protein